MKSFNEWLASVRSLVDAMPPQQRILAVLLAACVVASVGFLLRGSSETSREYLLAGKVWTDAELHAAEAAFGSAGLSDYRFEGQRIAVPTDLRDAYIKALAQNNAMPKQLGTSVADALASNNFLEPLERGRQRMRAAREQEIAVALTRLPFVENALVIYDEDRRGFSTQVARSASVFVQPRAGQTLTDAQKRNIMRQVAFSFGGLLYNDVSVMDLASGQAMSGQDDPMSAEEQKYYYIKDQREADLKEKALNLLADYGDVKVEVHVDLDTTLREATEKLVYNEKPTTVASSTTKVDTESATPTPVGRPGAEPNAISNRPTSLAALPQQTNRNKESTSTEQRVTGHETTLTDRVGLSIRYASISVRVPASYYRKAYLRQWLEENPGKSDTDFAALDPKATITNIARVTEEINQKIQQSLAALLPSGTAGSDRFPAVTVTDYLDEPPPPLPAVSMASTSLMYLLAYWQWIVMLLLAFVSLYMLRGFVAAAPGESRTEEAFRKGFDVQLSDPATWDLSALEEEAFGDEDDEEEAESKRRFQNNGAEIKDELTAMVRENPDAAASLLRTWIGDSL